MFVHSIASAVGMYIRDSMTVEATANLDNDQAAHMLVSDLTIIARIGLLPASYLSGYLLSYVSPAMVIGSAAVFPALVAIAAISLDDDPESSSVKRNSTSELVAAGAAVLDTKHGLLSTVTGRGLFTSIIPSYADAMFFYYTQALGFTPEFLGRFQFLGALAGIVGNTLSRSMYIDSKILSNISQFVSIPVYASLMLITTNTLSRYSSIPIGVFVLSRHFLLDFFSSLTNLPASVELMRTAPKGAEGGYLAMVGTLTDIGGMINSVVSAGTMHWLGIGSENFDHLTSLLAINNAMSFIATPLVLFYPRSMEIQEPLIRDDECVEEMVSIMDRSPRDA
jgi:hypothetical protein